MAIACPGRVWLEPESLLNMRVARWQDGLIVLVTDRAVWCLRDPVATQQALQQIAHTLCFEN
ncbi:unnamed protein product [Protopolystoma xenopodis]|uniref:Uncharacterized protein n=1 Tax=Protopolystoma xenopodis TaxID=117903 RepID=A0A448X4L1_9PLAT|nr:unnamed protein product [Protopolystoma xenopodis]